MKLHRHITVCLLTLSFSTAFAQEQPVVGEVIAGEKAYEVAVEVENWKDEPLSNVSVNVNNPPEDLVNFKVTPPLVGSLAAGEIATFIIYFDVAEDAVEDDVAQEFVELVFSVTAEGTEFDQPNPSISLAITEQPDAPAYEDVAPQGEGSAQMGSYVYVLTDIRVQDINWTEGAMSFQTEHQENQLGYLQRTKSAAHSEVKMVNCKDCPTQIVLGKPMHFQLEARIRYDGEVYHCDAMPGDRSAPQLLIASNIAFEASAKGKKLHFPSCQELGINLSELKGPANLPAVPTMASVALTRDESVSLTADFSFSGDATDHDSVFYNDPAFNYEAKYTSNGTLSDEIKKGKVTVEYSNTQFKTPEYLEKNEVTFAFNQLSLTYTLQVNDEPQPIAAVAFGEPAEFGAPHLVSSPMLAEGRLPGEEKVKPEAVGEDIVENDVELPNVIGMIYKNAVAAIEFAGLVALPPELGSNAPNPGYVGRVELALPTVNGQLKMGDNISLRLFGEVITRARVPDVVGLGIREAAKTVEAAGFTPAFELGAETTEPRKDQTIASQLPSPGLEVEEGTEIKLIVLTLVVSRISIPVKADGVPLSEPAVIEQGRCSAGLEWDEPTGRCVDNTPAAQVARFDCSAYPGAFPKWDETLEQPQCLCPSGWQWSKSDQRCVDNSPQAQVARADCKFAGIYVEAYWNYEKGAVRCRCLDGYYYNDDEVCTRDRVAQRQPPPEAGQNDIGDWQKIAADLTGILSRGTSNNGTRTQASSQKSSPAPSSGRNCAIDFTVRNISNFDCNCAGWGFDPKYGKCRQGFSDKYSSKPKTKQGQVYAGFGNSSGSSGKLHTCRDNSVRVDAYVSKYAQMYGGGEVSFEMKGNMVCYRNGYDKVLSGSIESYACSEDNFGNCSRQRTTKIDRRENRDGGAYKLILNGGQSSWVVSPK